MTGGGEISPAVSGWVHLSEDGGRSYGPRVLTSAWPIRSLVAVKGTRSVTKKHLIWNDATPRIEVDPETYTVRADGRVLTCAPASVLPMAQRYFLF